MKKALNSFIIATIAFALTLITASFGNIQGCLTSKYYTTSVGYGCVQGKTDTVAGSAADTFNLANNCNPASVVFTQDILKVAGSPTVIVNCYVSANGGATYATVPIVTYTAKPTSTVTPVTTITVINPAFGTNPYTNYMWTASNTASSTMSWKGSIKQTQ